ncbi:hypothetical protein D3C80_536960 [compost metagenome]
MRIAGHDVALAQGKAALRQVVVDQLGQGQQHLADLGSMGGVAGFEQDAVVLVGVQGLFTPPFAAKAQPAERDTRVALLCNGQFDDPADHVVIEQGDDLGDLAGGGAVGQHALDQLTDITAQGSQAFDAWGMANGAGEVYQVNPLQGKQIAFGHHAAQALFLDQAHMGDMPFGHGDGGIKSAGIGAQGKRCLGHVSVDGFAQLGAGVGNHLTQIAQGKDPQGGLLCVDDHDAADLLLVHLFHRLAQRRVRRAGDRMAHRQFAQACVERILGAQAFHGATLHLQVDLVKQAADPAQGKVAERAGKGKQLDECRLVQLQAEGVFSRQVFGTRGPFAEQRRQGEAFAGGDLEGGFSPAPGRTRPLTDDPPLLDDIKVFHRAVAGLDDTFALGEKAQLALFDQIRQMGIFHLVEWRETLQELQGTLDVLQHCRFTGLGKGVGFAHDHVRIVFIDLNGRPPGSGCPLDVSLKKYFCKSGALSIMGQEFRRTAEVQVEASTNAV